MVHFDQSGHFIAPFHLTKLLSPVPLFCILYQTCSGLGQISSADCIIPFREWNFQNFNPEFLLNRKCSLLIWQSCALAAPGGPWCLHVTFAPRWPDNHNFYAGHSRCYRFRTLGFGQFFLEQSLIWKLNHSITWMSIIIFFVRKILISFFWRIPRLHQQLIFITSLSKMKLGAEATCTMCWQLSMTGFDKRIQVSFNLFVLYKIFYSSLFGVQIGLISSKSHINTCCLSQNYGTPQTAPPPPTHTHTHTITTSNFPFYCEVLRATRVFKRWASRGHKISGHTCTWGWILKSSD